MDGLILTRWNATPLCCRNHRSNQRYLINELLGHFKIREGSLPNRQLDFKSDQDFCSDVHQYVGNTLVNVRPDRRSRHPTPKRHSFPLFTGIIQEVQCQMVFAGRLNNNDVHGCLDLLSLRIICDLAFLPMPRKVRGHKIYV